MTTHQDLSQQLSYIEHENGVLFGVKWSLVGILIAVCFLAGCDNLLPAEEPRYNRVIGERRAPMLNAESIAQAQTNLAPPPVPVAPAPQPMVAPTPQPVAMPQPMIQQAPIAAAPAPMPQPMMQPVPEPSMMDQLTGWFSSDPEPQPMPQPMMQPAPSGQVTYPSLPPTHYNPAPANTLPSQQQVEADIAALERELMQSQTQQTELQNTPVFSAVPGPAPAPAGFSQQPLPADNFSAVPQPNLSMQPLPEAPVIDPAMQAAHRAAPMPADPMIMADTPASMPVEVPMAPAVQPASPMSRLPSGLIPPDMQDEYGAGYLPASRYRGRTYSR